MKMLESALPSTKTISGNLPAASGATNTTGTNGTGGNFVAPWVGFNTDRQTGRNTFDMRVSKRFALGSRRNIEVLWEAFNLFNTVNESNFSPVAYSVPTGGATYDAATNVATVNLRPDPGYLIGRSASTNFWGPRDMQFGLRFFW